MLHSTISRWAWTPPRWCRRRTSSRLSDAFSRIIGRHGLKFGGEVHANQINTHPDVVFNGSFAFNGSETGLDFADFLLGVAVELHARPGGDFYNRNLYVAAFAQDSWKATNSLTVNYGVRWDRIRPWLRSSTSCRRWCRASSRRCFPARRRGWCFPAILACPSSLAPARNNFAPRIGIAWSPSAAAQTVGKIHRHSGTDQRAPWLRNVLHGLRRVVGGHHERQSAVWLYLHFSRAAAVRFAVHGGRYRRKCRAAIPVAESGVRREPRHIRTSSVNWSQFEPLVGIPAVDPNDVTPYAEHWMASVERQLGSATRWRR